MPFLRLRDVRTGTALEFGAAEVRIGRDPDLEFPISGDAAKIVSGVHVRLVHERGEWWIEDLGSRNGTYLNDRRLRSGARELVAPGAVIGLGESGPRIKVEAAAKRQMEETLAEEPHGVRPSAPTLKMSGLDDVSPAAAPARPRSGPSVPTPTPAAPRAAPPPAAPPPPPPPQTLRMLFREVRAGEQFEASGGRIRIGRGQECEVRPVGPSDTAVSRVHAEIVLKPNGTVVVRDARSRNGTFVNGKRLGTEHEIKLGDRILLGEGGPELIVEQFSAPGAPAAEPPSGRLAAVGEPPPKERPRRSFGGKGATVFFKEMMDETSKRSAARVRVIVWSFVALVAATAGGLYWWSERRVRETAAVLQAQQQQALAAQQAAADSMRLAATAEYERLRVELERARAGSAPAAVVDSLRTALTAAQDRTTALEAALRRAQAAMQEQLAAGDSVRRQAQRDLERLRAELAQANTSQVPRELLDSLRGAVQAAQQRANEVEARMRAVSGSGANLAAVSQANQGAVGLVSVFVGSELYDGTGFVISRSGYLVTNRHVVMPGGRTPDSLFVAMADQQYMSRATVVSVPPADGPDVALVRIAGYRGPFIAKVDWTGTRAAQGEPAALIGFPEGVSLALDRSRTVRTSMSAGWFSKVTPELIQFDGFTRPGSSGSPIFNANGEVVAVHRSGLREAAGLSFAVPVREVLPLLPADLRSELGSR